MHCFRANTWYRSENPRFVCVFVSPGLIPSFCVFEAKWLGRLQWRTIHFFSFKKRPNISLYVEYSRTLLWFFEDFKSAYKATKFYAKWLVRITVLRTKTCTNFTSQKICCLQSGSQILYAVEQFNLLSSKDKLKQGAHLHQTHDPPSPRMSWENCRAVPSKQLPHVLCGAGTYWTRLGRKGFSPVTDRRLCHADEPQ